MAQLLKLLWLWQTRSETAQKLILHNMAPLTGYDKHTLPVSTLIGQIFPLRQALVYVAQKRKEKKTKHNDKFPPQSSMGDLLLYNQLHYIMYHPCIFLFKWVKKQAKSDKVCAQKLRFRENKLLMNARDFQNQLNIQ